MLNIIISQIQEVSNLANEGVKSISAIDDPMTKLVIIILSLMVCVLGWGIIFMFKAKTKDFENKDDAIKKKDERLEENRAEIILIMNKNMETSINLNKTVEKLETTIKTIQENHAKSHDALLNRLTNDHEYFKRKISEIRQLIPK